MRLSFVYSADRSTDTVSVDPIICRRTTISELQDRILVFYTGLTRSASSVLKNQQTAVDSQKKKKTLLFRQF